MVEQSISPVNFRSLAGFVHRQQPVLCFSGSADVPCSNPSQTDQKQSSSSRSSQATSSMRLVASTRESKPDLVYFLVVIHDRPSARLN